MNRNKYSERFFNCLDNYNLDHVKVKIFMCLDYKSLHIARQVSRGWKDFIDKEIWSARKSHAKKLIAREWRNNEPTLRIVECHNRVRDVTVDDNILLAESFKKILKLKPSSGEYIDFVPGLSIKIHGSWDTVHGTRDISSRIIAIGMGHGQVPGQVIIWDRSSLRLLCSVHLPQNEEYLTNDEYASVEYVRCVKIVGDFIVAGGFDGTLTAFSFRSILDQAAPKNGVIIDFEGVRYVMDIWEFTDLNLIEETLTTKMDQKILFMKKDGTWLLVISNNGGALWDFSTRSPRLKTMNMGILPLRVSDCALKYPYAFFARKGQLRGHKFVQIFDIEKKKTIRTIQVRGPEVGILCITVNENFMASKIRGGNHRQHPKSRIFIHDLEELVNPTISTSDLWMKTLEYPVFDEVSGMITTNYYVAINSSSVFAISGYGCEEGFKRIYIWDFLNNKNSEKCPARSSLLHRLINWTRNNL